MAGKQSWWLNWDLCESRQEAAMADLSRHLKSHRLEASVQTALPWMLPEQGTCMLLCVSEYSTGRRVITIIINDNTT